MKRRPKRKRERWYIIPENLEMMRTYGRCQWCGKTCQLCEPAHVFAKGSGGIKPPGDSRINLLAMGSTQDFECSCHTMTHCDSKKALSKVMTKARMGTILDTSIKLVAIRERTTFKVIETALYELALCTKDTTEQELEDRGLLKWVRGGFGSCAIGTGGSKGSVNGIIHGLDNTKIEIPF